MDPIAIDNPAEVVAAKTAAIHAAMLQQSPRLLTANFAAINSRDVQLLFDLYDREFFGSWLAKTVQEISGRPLGFRVSSGMSKAGGKTLHGIRTGLDGKRQHLYQIAIASRLLFNTFGNIQRPVEVCGQLCTDRLQAMQRIMEHEIIHLIELLIWDKSSCKAARFKTLAKRIFNHTGTTHDLVTAREVAAKQHAINIGGTVAFEFEGQRHIGMVNRINHRATVLVESKRGMPYSNGKTYLKFYIPLRMLEPVQNGG